ncbi:MAG: DUF3795 domain-containing protein, partial [Chloroflexia bacterium]|nr:DUF3795 domain-containing protein [Chloroflexia bacterium]
MKTTDRRDFLKKSAIAGIATCTLLNATKFASAAINFVISDDEIDPKKLNYCGYTCPSDCKFKTASVNNDVELKKEAYKAWKIKEKYNIDFDEEKIFCFGCKTKDKPEGVVTLNCTVRACAIEKGLDCCIECDNLSTCDKQLWKQFPDFKKKVIEMQKNIMSTSKNQNKMSKFIIILIIITCSLSVNAQEFFAALWQGNTEVVKKHIEESSEDLNQILNYDLTPLQIVSVWGQRNQEEIISFLLEKG